MYVVHSDKGASTLITFVSRFTFVSTVKYHNGGYLKNVTWPTLEDFQTDEDVKP